MSTPSSSAGVDLPTELLADATVADCHGLDGLLTLAGLRRSGGSPTDTRLTVERTAADLPLLRLRPLQDAAGRLRHSAAEVLKGPLTAEEVADGHLRAAVEEGTIQVDTALNGLQVELVANLDPLPPLTRFLAQHGDDVRFFRLEVSPLLGFRAAFWRLLAAARDGQSLHALRAGGTLPDRTVVQGADEVLPGRIVVLPLVARIQPLGALVQTATGAELIAVSRGAFERPQPRVAGWPTGAAPVFSISPSVDRVFRVAHWPDNHGKQVLDDSIAGASGLLDYVTDPTNWVDERGQIDLSERLIAFSSLALGCQRGGPDCAELAPLQRYLGSLHRAWSANGLLGGKESQLCQT